MTREFGLFSLCFKLLVGVWTWELGTKKMRHKVFTQNSTNSIVPYSLLGKY